MHSIHIERLCPEDRVEYDSLVSLSRNGMRSHTLRWAEVLQRFTKTEAMHLVAKLNGKIVGVLPSFMKKNTKYGNVLNSLPFFGTHGGPVVLDTLKESIQVKEKLLLAFKELAKENDCIFSTLITTPFEANPKLIQEILKPDFIDSRITQMTVFPEMTNIEKGIMNIVEKRCRTAIRKAQKSNIEVEFAQNLRHVNALFEMHKSGMKKKHGIYKPWRFFKILFEEFPDVQSRDIKVLFASKDDKIIAGLLLLYYKNIVSYFTPCFDLKYSGLQPNTLLIYEAMKNTLKNGYKIWNFGGGSRFSGVYMFKRSWGAKDYPYQYFINAYRDTGEIQGLQEEEILSEYKWFYVLPFTELRKRNAQ
jgi:CelD/BcsL family acetyltransferase involved in cellulose biosynthesis